MWADSEALLALLLESHFGSEWFARWRAVDDPEVRWLAIYLAAEASNGRNVNGERSALGLIAEGRARFPTLARIGREPGVLLERLRAASLWPVAPGGTPA